MAVVYEWDEAKATSNLIKHGVSFLKAAAVFDDPRHLLLDATRWADGEERQKVLGEIDGRLFALVFTRRGDIHRLISARRANKSEERLYGDSSLRS